MDDIDVVIKTKQPELKNCFPVMLLSFCSFNLQSFPSFQVINLHKEKNIRFSRFQDNKTILHLGAERNSARVYRHFLLLICYARQQYMVWFFMPQFSKSIEDS